MNHESQVRTRHILNQADSPAQVVAAKRWTEDPRCTRREWLSRTSAWASGAVLTATAARTHAAAVRIPTDKPCPIAIFTKPLQFLNYKELAQTVADLGAQGVEATVRKGGHVEPTRVEEDLPKLVDALAKQDLKVLIMASDINRADDPINRNVLTTASRLGIAQYRMKYFTYDLKSQQPLTEQLAAWRPQARELAALNKELGITGVYQNHAGARYVGAGVWDLVHLLEGIPPTQIGSAYDVRHATVEGGMSWQTTARLIRPMLQAIYVKDFVWDGRKPKNVPLGEGRVDPAILELLVDAQFRGPVSLHMEYFDHRDPKLTPQSIAALRHDIQILQRWWEPIRKRLDQ